MPNDLLPGSGEAEPRTGFAPPYRALLGTPAELPRQVHPGQSVLLAVDGQAPSRPGEYVARVDMLRGRDGWFADRKRSSPQAVKILVR